MLPKAKTKSSTTTRRANPDAKLFQMMERCAAIWLECQHLDNFSSMCANCRSIASGFHRPVSLSSVEAVVRKPDTLTSSLA